jgi:hypothetical protein
MEYAPCSLDLAPNDIWLFPKIKSALKRGSFQDTEDIQKKCDEDTESYSTTGVPKMFQQWQHYWAKCIATQGQYLEGDPSQ